MAKTSGTTKSVGSGSASASRTTALVNNIASIAENAFSKKGVTKIGDYEIEVRGIVSQNIESNNYGLNLTSELYTEIRKDGKVVAWNATQPGGEKQRDKWVKEQIKKFKI